MILEKQPRMLERALGVENLDGVLPQRMPYQNQEHNIDHLEDVPLLYQLNQLLKLTDGMKLEKRDGDSELRRGFTEWFDERQYRVGSSVCWVATRFELVRPSNFSPLHRRLHVQTRRSCELGALVDDAYAAHYSLEWDRRAPSEALPSVRLRQDGHAGEAVTSQHVEWSELTETISTGFADLVGYTA